MREPHVLTLSVTYDRAVWGDMDAGLVGEVLGLLAAANRDADVGGGDEAAMRLARATGSITLPRWGEYDPPRDLRCPSCGGYPDAARCAGYRDVRRAQVPCPFTANACGCSSYGEHKRCAWCRGKEIIEDNCRGW